MQNSTQPEGRQTDQLALVPTLARTGLARLLFNPKDGEPVAQARQFLRDLAAMPVDLNRAAKVTSLGNRPLAVVTASNGYQLAGSDTSSS